MRWTTAPEPPIQEESDGLEARYPLEGVAQDVAERRLVDEAWLQLQADAQIQQERNRIVGDLHDDTVQSLYALGLGLHASRDDEQMTREALADDVIAGLSAVIESLRVYMHRLTSNDLDGVGEDLRLDERIRSLVGGHGSTRWTSEIASGLGLTPAAERELCLLVKELVSNVERHAHASSATLTLRHDQQGNVDLVIEDDGVGFDPTTVAARSFGMRSMAFRAERLVAQLEIDSTPGVGTRVRICVPPATPSTARGRGV